MNTIKWIIIIPLALIGGVNVFRGFCAILEKDGDKFNFKHDWQVGLFWLIEIASYVALFYAVGKLIL